MLAFLLSENFLQDWHTTWLQAGLRDISNHWRMFQFRSVAIHHSVQLTSFLVTRKYFMTWQNILFAEFREKKMESADQWKTSFGVSVKDFEESSNRITIPSDGNTVYAFLNNWLLSFLWQHCLLSLPSLPIRKVDYIFEHTSIFLFTNGFITVYEEFLEVYIHL